MKKISLFLVLFLTLLLTYSAISNVSVKQPGNSYGLAAWYPLNGNANDTIGNDHNGVVYGATLTTDRFGNADKAFSFNGSSDYIEISSAHTLRFPEYTYEAWIYPTAHPAGGIIQKGAATILQIGGIIGDQVLNIGNFLGVYTGIGGFGYYLGGGTYNTQTGVLPALNQWYHVVGTRSNTHYKLFINGVLIQSVSLLPIAPEYDISTKGFIGNRGDIQYFEGKIDDVRIYNIALTEMQVKDQYINESMVAYYPFNGNANDESGNGNNGTITGALVTPAADRYGEEGKAYKFWFPDYVSVPTNSSFFTDEFTVSYWYKVEAYWGDRGVLSCVGNKGGYQQVFAAGTTFTYLLGYNFPGSSWFWTNYSVPNTPNIWQHITTTYTKTGDNASISKLYINGELKSSDTYGNSIAYPGSEIFYIGKNHSELGLNGELDDVRMYNKTLNDQEIIDLYLAETKPVLQYPENQSSVPTLTPEMLWSSPLANGEFRFQLSTDSLFGTILHELVATDLKTQLPDALLVEGQNYYWRVCALLNGETGSWSPAWSFDFVNTRLDKPDREVVSLRISPNPADISAKIVYSIPASNGLKSLVTLELVNSIGIVKAIKIKNLQNQAPGNYEITFDTSDLEAGIYFCRLKTKTNQAIGKMVVIH